MGWKLMGLQVQTFYDAVEKRLGVNKFGLVNAFSSSCFLLPSPSATPSLSWSTLLLTGLL